MARFCLGIVIAVSSFLLGMRLISRTLQGATATGFQRLLGRLTERPLPAFLLGTVMTMVIQSSSATTVMTVALVDAGVLPFRQALPLVAGANVGTTITAQIVSLELYQLIIPTLLGGLALAGWPRTRAFGQVLLGLGLLFFGLRSLGSYLPPLLRLPWAQVLLSRCAASPCFAFAVGLLLTAVVQSSSAVTAMLISLSHSPWLTLSTALAVALGSNVGTCVTALLAALTTSERGRQVAYAHLAFNLLGVAITAPFFAGFVRLVSLTAPDLPRQIANGHTLFNLQTAVVFLAGGRWLVQRPGRRHRV